MYTPNIINVCMCNVWDVYVCRFMFMLCSEMKNHACIKIIIHNTHINFVVHSRSHKMACNVLSLHVEDSVELSLTDLKRYWCYIISDTMRQCLLNPVSTQVINFHSQIGAMYENGIVPWGAHPGNLWTYKQIKGQKSENITHIWILSASFINLNNALRIETVYGLHSI